MNTTTLKQKILINICSFLLVVTGVFFVKPIDVLADETDNGMGFSVSPILPSSQIDRDLGYYYLETKPGEEQTIEVRLASQKKEKQTIQLFVEDAYTGTNGGLDYGVNGIKNFNQDETLINATSEIIKPVSETIDLEADEEKIVSFKLTPPKENYTGVKIGRLVFKGVGEEKESNSPVKEEHQFAISVILSENGDEYNDGDINTLELNEVKPTVKRGKRMVTANLHNPEPKRIVNLQMIASVTKKGDSKVIKQTKIDEFQFAPNSNVDLEVDWGLTELAAGEYTINISFENEYENVQLTKDFRITTDVAKKLNKESAFKIKTPTWVKFIAVGSGIVSLLLSIVVIIRNKKWLKLSQKRRRNKTRNKKK